ncbi:hypothetical protein [Ruegeria atlantica]|uniref:hypothetical protein n=1 Tax=Ruegeria atlantica TaxID=81569 RepID=UPI00147ADBD5|nr:hypothetical protein [Ruegeria atlantica]
MKLLLAHAICAEVTTTAITNAIAEGLSKATPDSPLKPSFRPTIGRVTDFLKVFSKTVDCFTPCLNNHSIRFVQIAFDDAVDLASQPGETFW